MVSSNEFGYHFRDLNLTQLLVVQCHPEVKKPEQWKPLQAASVVGSRKNEQARAETTVSGINEEPPNPSNKETIDLVTIDNVTINK